MSRSRAQFWTLYKIPRKKTPFFEDVSSESAIFENQGVVQFVSSPPWQDYFKGNLASQLDPSWISKRSFFEDVSSESASFEDKRCSEAQKKPTVSCESAILDIS